MTAWEMKNALVQSCRGGPGEAVVLSDDVLGSYYHIKGVREVDHYGRRLVVLDVGEELP